MKLQDHNQSEESTSEIIEYSLDEFSRSGNFERVFPLKSNIEYYSQFIERPGKENLALWEYMKNTLDNL
jgi:hypothetical protein